MHSDLPLSKDRIRSNSQDHISAKRMRTGSISGRLRTASDLEEMGYIDKTQKGAIKDLIISGDSKLLELLDKYEQGHKEELLELLNSGSFARKDSIDLLDGLDFEFLSHMRSFSEGNEESFDFSGMGDATVNHIPLSGALHHHNHHHIPPPPSSSTAHKVLDDSFEHNRRGSIDALLTGALMDDLVATHPPEEGGVVHELDFHSIFEHFPEGGGNKAHSPRSGEKQRKSLRLTMSHQQHDETDLSPEKVDLSAYASHAASLQQQNLDKKFSSVSSNNGLRVKSEAKTTSVTSSSSSAPQRLLSVKNEPLSATSSSTIKSPYIVSPYMTNLTSSAATSSASMDASLAPLGSNGLSSYGATSSSSALGSSLYSVDPLLSSSLMSMADLHGGVGQTATSGLCASNTTVNGSTRLAGYIGAYSPEQRKLRIEKFLEKRSRRVWTRKVKYDVRKNFADSRLRIKGRFVKKEDEDIMRELLSI